MHQWKINGTQRHERVTFTVTAPDYNAAVRTASMKHLTVVRDCVLLDADPEASREQARRFVR